MSVTKDKHEYDLVLVGGSPSNLVLAHRLLDQLKDKPEQKMSIAILEKAENFGSHIVSGAVVNPSIFKKCFPNHVADEMPIEAICDKSYFSLMGAKKKWDVPMTATRALVPDFFKEGYYVLTLSLVVEWMAKSLYEKSLEVPNVKLDMFPGFPANKVLYEGDKVVGVTIARSGDPLEDNLYAKLVVFGDKGFLSKDVIDKFNLRPNPQLWSVGVKETWKLADNAPDLSGKVWHTLGYPTLDGTLGGGFIYGLQNKRVTIGLVISLDSHNPNIHPQNQLQEYKKHPFLQDLLKGAELQHYGAAVLPEGGMASLPTEFQANGALFLGDALGLLDMKALAGVDKAMESGYIAANTILDAFAANDFSAKQLSSYQEKLMASPFMDKMKENKYFRKVFSDHPQLLKDYLPKVLNSIDATGNPILGGLQVGLTDPINAISSSLHAANLMFNAKDTKEEIKYREGYECIDSNFSKELMKRGLTNDSFEKNTFYSREDAVFYAHTKYAEHPDHIDEFSADTCLKCIKKYEAAGFEAPCVSDCTAEVHRIDIKDDGLHVHGMSLENCVQCRTCELICPEQNLRVNAAYSGAGPDFRGL